MNKKNNYNVYLTQMYLNNARCFRWGRIGKWLPMRAYVQLEMPSLEGFPKSLFLNKRLRSNKSLPQNKRLTFGKLANKCPLFYPSLFATARISREKPFIYLQFNIFRSFQARQLHGTSKVSQSIIFVLIPWQNEVKGNSSLSHNHINKFNEFNSISLFNISYSWCDICKDFTD